MSASVISATLCCFQCFFLFLLPIANHFQQRRTGKTSNSVPLDFFSPDTIYVAEILVRAAAALYLVYCSRRCSKREAVLIKLRERLSYHHLPYIHQIQHVIQMSALWQIKQTSCCCSSQKIQTFAHPPFCATLQPSSFNSSQIEQCNCLDISSLEWTALRSLLEKQREVEYVLISIKVCVLPVLKSSCSPHISFYLKLQSVLFSAGVCFLFPGCHLHFFACMHNRCQAAAGRPDKRHRKSQNHRFLLKGILTELNSLMNF